MLLRLRFLALVVPLSVIHQNPPFPSRPSEVRCEREPARPQHKRTEFLQANPGAPVSSVRAAIIRRDRNLRRRVPRARGLCGRDHLARTHPHKRAWALIRASAPRSSGPDRDLTGGSPEPGPSSGSATIILHPCGSLAAA